MATKTSQNSSKNPTARRSLPELAGLCTFAEAALPGLGVQEVVARLKRYHYCLHRLWNVFLARLAAEPVYEIKMIFSLHAYLAAELVNGHRARVAEMRHPPLGLEQIPHPGLEIFFDEIRSAPSIEEVCRAIYHHALPSLRQAMDQHLHDTNLLADAPTVRLLQHALLDMDDMIRVGQATCLSLSASHNRDWEWEKLLAACLASAGGVAGTGELNDVLPERTYSAAPYVYDSTPRRDERFPDPYNMGVHAEEFLYSEKFQPIDKTLMMYYKRLREIDVPEMMASILVEMGDKPWEFYRDMTRQLWDEARHAMMGEIGFVNLGIDWAKFVMVNFTWSKGLNEQLTPQERHAVLWFIEQGLMNKTGKRFEWEVGRESGDPLAATFQDFDWADEVLHARIGRDWYVDNFDNIETAAAYGNECWNKVVSDWETWKREGKTEHRNWWPALYAEFCRLRGIDPDAETLAYNTTYATTRADLQRIAQSG